MEANSRKEIQEASAGDIVALVGLKNLATGDTLTDPKKPIRYESLSFPAPVIYVAIEPKSTVDTTRLNKSLERLKAEDPSFDVKEDKETGQVLIGGMGELHLEIMVDRLKRDFRVDANVGQPQVAYREGILTESQHQEIYEKQLANLNRFASLTIKISPDPEVENLKFINQVSTKELPEHFIPHIKQGLEDGLLAGAIAGYPVIGVSCTLIGGAFDEQLSDETSFRIAANQAIRKAVQKAQPLLLEPVMQLEVLVPDDYLSNIITDLNSRKAKVSSIEVKTNLQAVHACAPLSSMFGYSTDLRSISQGRATYSMQFGSYEQVSSELMKKFGM